jgi:hypothetical protein
MVRDVILQLLFGILVETTTFRVLLLGNFSRGDTEKKLIETKNGIWWSTFWLVGEYQPVLERKGMSYNLT